MLPDIIQRYAAPVAGLLVFAVLGAVWTSAWASPALQRQRAFSRR